MAYESQNRQVCEATGLSQVSYVTPNRGFLLRTISHLRGLESRHVALATYLLRSLGRGNQDSLPIDERLLPLVLVLLDLVGSDLPAFLESFLDETPLL